MPTLIAIGYQDETTLFLLVDERRADLVLDALGRYGGRVHRLDRMKAGDVDGSGR
jgi:hypothetical protein